MGNSSKKPSKRLSLNEETLASFMSAIIVPEIQKVLVKEYRRLKQGITSRLLVQTYDVINGLLPKLPECLEHGISDSEPFRRASGLCQDLTEVDCMIKSTFLELSSMFKCVLKHRKCLTLLEAVIFAKMIYFAGDGTLKRIASMANLYKILTSMLSSPDDDNCLVATKIYMLICVRLSSKQSIPNNDCLLKLKFWYEKMTENLEKDAPAPSLYDRFDFKNVLSGTFPALDELSVAVTHFKHSNHMRALKIVRNCLVEGDQQGGEIVHSGVLDQLVSFLCPDNEPLAKENNLNNFLTVFVALQHEAGVTFDATHFKKLVRSVVTAYEYLLDSYECDDNFKGSSYFLFRKKALESAMLLLNYLYMLNMSWSHWLDIFFEERQLISKEEFRSKKLELLFKEDKRFHSMGWKHFTLYSKCPFILSFDIRKSLFYASVDQEVRKCRQGRSNTSSLPVSRENVLEEVRQMFDGLPCLHPKFAFSFKNEMGVGEGPTREVFRVISKQIQLSHMNLWFGDKIATIEQFEAKHFTFSPNGLYPRSARKGDKVLRDFEFFGTFVAKALADRELLDVPLNRAFYRAVTSSLHSKFRKNHFDVTSILPITSKLIQQLVVVKRVKDGITSNPHLSSDEKLRLIECLPFDEGCSFEDLMINFTIPGHPDIELVEGGADVMLSSENFEEYLDRLGDFVVNEGSKHCFSRFLKGFRRLLPTSLDILSPGELELLLIGEPSEKWHVKYLEKCCVWDSAYIISSKTIRYLFQVLSAFNFEEQKLFLQFVTGRSTLPVGGLAHLDPPLKISRQIYYGSPSDSPLPTSSTCFNILFIPEYETAEIMKSKLLQAIREGKDSFHLL